MGEELIEFGGGLTKSPHLSSITNFSKLTKAAGVGTNPLSILILVSWVLPVTALEEFTLMSFFSPCPSPEGRCNSCCTGQQEEVGRLQEWAVRLNVR